MFVLESHDIRRRDYAVLVPASRRPAGNKDVPAVDPGRIKVKAVAAGAQVEVRNIFLVARVKVVVIGNAAGGFGPDIQNPKVDSFVDPAGDVMVLEDFGH